MVAGHKHLHSAIDRSALMSAEGIRAIKISTFGLLLTALVQFVIVLVGGSVALLADALHNFGDVFTTVGLWVAFIASRRAANRRYTFGYDRFEDLMGIVIVLIIAGTAAIAGYESYRALIEPRVIQALGASIAAAFVGVLGNEAVAQYKIRVGRRINSVALEADGMHSRTDGLVSAGAVAGLTGVALGYPMADPLAAAGITIAILWVMIGTARDVIARLVDRVDPELCDRLAGIGAAQPGVADVHDVRARWAGRSLYVQMHLGVEAGKPLVEAHAIGERVRHAILHDVEGVAQCIVHLDPWAPGVDHSVYHTDTAHHIGPD